MNNDNQDPRLKAWKQKIFNTVVPQLLKQNEKSMAGGMCRYRGPNGLKCAVGFLIKDQFYHKVLENQACDDKDVMKALHKSGVFDHKKVDLSEDNLVYEENFLSCLQGIHDVNNPQNWPYCFKKLATRHELDYSVINEYKSV